MSRREYKNGEIALLHFDFPYYGETGDGLRDEIGKLSWSAQGNAKLVGAEAPVAQVVEGTPKFGYRCLQTAANTDYIKAEEITGLLNINKAGNYEIECFLRPTNVTAPGNILALLNAGTEVFSAAVSSTGNVVVTVDDTPLVSSVLLSQDAWTHLLIRISGGNLNLYLNGAEAGTGSIAAGIVEADEIRLGGFVGQMDEVRIRNAAGSGIPTVPAAPYQGSINLKSLGGFGDGSTGDDTITQAGVDINTTAMVQSGSQQNLILGEQSVGRYGTIQPGDKVMIHVSRGKTADATEEFSRFSIRTVASFNGGVLTLDSAITEFVVSPSEYYIQVVRIPQFRNLNIASGGSLIPKAWNATTGGGIVAAMVQGNCTVSGKITTTGKGIIRIEQMPFCHSMMPDRFLLTGNVFLLCGGTLSGTGFIGNDWSGDGEGGTGGSGGAKTASPLQWIRHPSLPEYDYTQGSPGTAGQNAGNGYGGGGGGGGGGSVNRDDSYAFCSNGSHGNIGKVGFGGDGGNGGKSLAFPVGVPGSPPSGESGQAPGNKAPCLIIVAKILAPSLAISFGGLGANGGSRGKTYVNPSVNTYQSHGGRGKGGFGTGFAYIAYKEVV